MEMLKMILARATDSKQKILLFKLLSRLPGLPLCDTPPSMEQDGMIPRRHSAGERANSALLGPSHDLTDRDPLSFDDQRRHPRFPRRYYERKRKLTADIPLLMEAVEAGVGDANTDGSPASPSSPSFVTRLNGSSAMNRGTLGSGHIGSGGGVSSSGGGIGGVVGVNGVAVGGGIVSDGVGIGNSVMNFNGVGGSPSGRDRGGGVRGLLAEGGVLFGTERGGGYFNRAAATPGASTSSRGPRVVLAGSDGSSGGGNGSVVSGAQSETGRSSSARPVSWPGKRREGGLGSGGVGARGGGSGGGGGAAAASAGGGTFIV